MTAKEARDLALGAHWEKVRKQQEMIEFDIKDAVSRGEFVTTTTFKPGEGVYEEVLTHFRDLGFGVEEPDDETMFSRLIIKW